MRSLSFAIIAASAKPAKVSVSIPSDARGRVIMRVAAKAGDAIMLGVEDNGRGVAPELADNIFDAYQTTKPRGMGLGLHLSRRIVQRHAGRLWWEPIRQGARDL
jgi:nitrogen fixation/metabolism regulation signal transduction histidine kinase